MNPVFRGVSSECNPFPKGVLGCKGWDTVPKSCCRFFPRVVLKYFLYGEFVLLSTWRLAHAYKKFTVNVVERALFIA